VQTAEVFADLQEAWAGRDAGSVGAALKKHYGKTGTGGDAGSVISPRSVANICMCLAIGDEKGVKHELHLGKKEMV
jgi:hypothetical protein